jgi:hypothetical protein
MPRWDCGYARKNLQWRGGELRHALHVCSNFRKTDTKDQCFCAGKCLCLPLVKSIPRRQNIARWLPCIPCLPTLPEARPVGRWSLCRKVNSSSWQTTRAMMATMVPTSTKWLQTMEIDRYPLTNRGYRDRLSGFGPANPRWSHDCITPARG